MTTGASLLYSEPFRQLLIPRTVQMFKQPDVNNNTLGIYHCNMFFYHLSSFKDVHL